MLYAFRIGASQETFFEGGNAPLAFQETFTPWVAAVVVAATEEYIPR